MTNERAASITIFLAIIQAKEYLYKMKHISLSMEELKDIKDISSIKRELNYARDYYKSASASSNPVGVEMIRDRIAKLEKELGESRLKKL